MQVGGRKDKGLDPPKKLGKKWMHLFLKIASLQANNWNMFVDQKSPCLLEVGILGLRAKGGEGGGGGGVVDPILV